uniref:Mitochondrial carrier protein n=1 Tax=viral metagenome TaxID=1070528 RepID=A0A6C0BDB6_9ZZZZ
MEFKNFINSAIATGVAELIMSPVCLVKTNFQNGKVSISQTIKQIYQKYGIGGFYTAGPIAISTQIFSTSSKFFMYKLICDNVGGNNYINNTFGCLCVSILTHPLDWIKVNQQMHVSKILFTILENPTTLYRGYSKTFCKTLISAPLFFPLQEELKERTGSGVLGSILSSTIATIAMQPLDYLKNRQMYGNDLYGTPGFKIYFRGFTLNLFRVVPHFVMVMSITEFLNKKL